MSKNKNKTIFKMYKRLINRQFVFICRNATIFMFIKYFILMFFLLHGRVKHFCYTIIYHVLELSVLF